MRNSALAFYLRNVQETSSLVEGKVNHKILCISARKSKSKYCASLMGIDDTVNIISE